MRMILVPLAVAVLSAVLPAAAQKPDMKGGAVVTSEPGRAQAVAAAEMSAQVVAIDKKTRTVTLKGPKGKVVDIVAPEEVKNFGQIKVGDFLMVRYVQSLALELQKAKSGTSGISVSDAAVKAEPGQRPAVAAAREISAIAKVTAVDPKAKTISLQGPRGNVVALDVQNPEQFKVVKVGDEVLVTYTEAVAVSIEPAKKPAAKKAEAKK
jgi:DNA-binding beta-propeller fold protein YncE